MGTNWFDALTKAWITGTTRRRTLAGAFSGTLAAVGLAFGEDVDAAKSGQCKKTCGQCEFCQTGRCKRKNGKKRCQKGKCENLRSGTSCTGGNGNCRCSRAIEGDAFCAAQVLLECSANCTSSGQCPAGRRCIRCGDTESTACAPECGVV